MPKTAPLDSVEAAYEAAIKMITRKSRTCTEVHDALIAKGAHEGDVESVLGRLKSHRHLDDAELASDQALALIETKGVSPELAVYKLTTRGIAADLARRSVDEAREGRTEWTLCERALGLRRRGKALSEAEAGREGRALARLGYEEEIVTRVIERAVRGSGR